MNPIVTKSFAITVLIFAFTSWSAPDPAPIPLEDEWKLKKETEHIKVYYRKSADSRVNELKLLTTVNSSLSGLVSLLRDVPNYTNWIYKCEKVEPLGQSTHSEGRYWAELDFPWPLQNRDMICHSRISQDPKTKVVAIKVEGQPAYLEKKDGIVRIEVLELTWTLTPAPDGQIHIEYQLLSDPGGVLPGWLINLAIDQGPTQTIRSLREQVAGQKYQSSKLSYIQEG
jgi:hypothetical protein